MLRERWVRAAIRPGNCRAVAQRPHVRVATTPHRVIDRDPATLIVHDGNGSGDDARHDPRGEHNGARVNDLVVDAHTTGLDRPDGRGDADVSAAPLEHTCSRDGQLRINLRQNAWPRLKQQETNLLASKS